MRTDTLKYGKHKCNGKWSEHTGTGNGFFNRATTTNSSNIPAGLQIDLCAIFRTGIQEYRREGWNEPNTYVPHDRHAFHIYVRRPKWQGRVEPVPLPPSTSNSDLEPSGYFILIAPKSFTVMEFTWKADTPNRVLLHRNAIFQDVSLSVGNPTHVKLTYFSNLEEIFVPVHGRRTVDRDAEILGHVFHVVCGNDFLFLAIYVNH